MEDEGKTKKQLISEVIELRQWVAELNATETERRQAGAALRKAHDELERRVAQVPDSNLKSKSFQTVANKVSATTPSVKALFLLT